MHAFTAHFAFEFRTGIRNKNLLLLNYLFPLGFYLMMGLIMTGINPLFQDTILPAMTLFAILAATLLGLPDPLVNARESGIFRSYKINGVPAASILAIPALTTALHLTVVMAIISLTAPLLFDAPVPQNWGAFLLVFAVATFACASWGVLIGVVSPSTRMTVLYAQAVFLPSMLIGGLMLPYSMLPETAAAFAQLLPATHAMNAFNGLAMGVGADFSPWGSLVVLLLSGFLALGLAGYLFSWDSRNTERRGHPLLALLVLLPFMVGWLLF
jgi:ABC-2 type transport system permease protein